MTITREEAINTLYEVINCGILDKEIEDQLVEIASCVNAERYGVHLWGAEEDEENYTPYLYGPSDHEEKEIMSNIEELYEDDTEDGAEDNSNSVE